METPRRGSFSRSIGCRITTIICRNTSLATPPRQAHSGGMSNYIFVLILAALPAFSASGPSPCASNPEARQLDFWLGDWSVGTKQAPNTGHSQVSLALDKCLVTESWGSDTSNHQGENAIAYSPDDKTWHGLFVDNRGR